MFFFALKKSFIIPEKIETIRSIQLVCSGQRNHIRHLPKHFHNMPPPPLPLVFNVESVVALLPLFKLLSSHFLLLIKSRFTLTLSRKCGHSMFANLVNLLKIYSTCNVLRLISMAKKGRQMKFVFDIVLV